MDPPRPAQFRGLRYYPYDPAWRVEGSLDQNLTQEALGVGLGADGMRHYTRIAAVGFTSPLGPATPGLFWIER